jgi:Xaa-Pro aminopeptidase
MPYPAAHLARRQRLMERVQRPILLMGNAPRDRNLPGSDLPFRQDSTLLYYTGCALPGAAALLEAGTTTLYLPAPADDDDLWHGHVTGADALRDRYGVDRVVFGSDDDLRALSGRTPVTLAVADPARTALAAEISGTRLRFGDQFGDEALADAVISQRRTKAPEELDELRAASAVTVHAHKVAMRAARPGMTEAALTAVFEAVLHARGCTTGYDTILTQRGEILHNHAHDGTLTEGQLLLLDGGAERASGYTADVTRTWPVSGRYTPRQRAAYEAVLAAQSASIAIARAGTRYRHVHDASSKVIAQFLIDEHILHDTTAEDAVARGAHALFFPHGVGHLLGLDVHDLKAFGDRAAYAPGAARSDQFGTCYLRLDLPLEPGWVVTIEPGFYVVPSILRRAELRERFADILNVDKAAEWAGFGGIRIEDDVHITAGDPEILTAGAPKSITEVEGLIGAGVSLEEVLG